MGIAAANLSCSAVEQLTFFDDPSAHKAERLETSMDDIRRRFGNLAVRRGVVLLNIRWQKWTFRQSILSIPYPISAKEV